MKGESDWLALFVASAAPGRLGRSEMLRSLRHCYLRAQSKTLHHRSLGGERERERERERESERERETDRQTDREREGGGGGSEAKNKGSHSGSFVFLFEEDN